MPRVKDVTFPAVGSARFARCNLKLEHCSLQGKTRHRLIDERFWPVSVPYPKVQDASAV
jgi:hypothetical protein